MAMTRIVGFGSVREAVEALKKHDENVAGFYEDPMTEAMGVPTGDFQRDFDVKERKILGFILENAPEGSEEQELALDRLDKWMP